MADHGQDNMAEVDGGSYGPIETSSDHPKEKKEYRRLELTFRLNTLASMAKSGSNRVQV